MKPEQGPRVLPKRPHGRCWSNPYTPHGVGHNSVCICNCPECVSERSGGADAAQGAQGELFEESDRFTKE